jgi:hypothetical protein
MKIDEGIGAFANAGGGVEGTVPRGGGDRLGIEWAVGRRPKQ